MYPISNITVSQSLENMVLISENVTLFKRVEMALSKAAKVILDEAKENTYTETIVDGETVITEGENNVPSEVIRYAKNVAHNAAERQHNARKIINVGLVEGLIVNETVDDQTILNIITTLVNDRDFMKVAL